MEKTWIIMGDFNDCTIEWGTRDTTHSTELLKAFEMLEVLLLYTGSTPTFWRNSTSSIVDVTFASDSLIKWIEALRISDLYSSIL